MLQHLKLARREPFQLLCIRRRRDALNGMTLIGKEAVAVLRGGDRQQNIVERSLLADITVRTRLRAARRIKVRTFGGDHNNNAGKAHITHALN